MSAHSHKEAAGQSTIHPAPEEEDDKPSRPVKQEEELRQPTAAQPKLPVQRRVKKSWDVALSFPAKLFNMLEDAEMEGHADIVSFLPDGKSFKIHKPDECAQIVLPEYFRTTRLSSFQKQLSLYGFKTIRSGPDRGAISHEFFQRDDKRLIAKIQRKHQPLPKAEPVYQRLEREDVWRGSIGGSD